MKNMKFFQLIVSWFKISFKSNPNPSLDVGKLESNQINKKSKFMFKLKKFFTFNQILRIIFILICFSFFCFSAHKIIKQYLEYNTIVMLQLIRPNDIDLPAITVCGPFIISNQTLLKTYGEYQSNFKLMKKNKNHTVMDEKKELSAIRDEYEEKAFKEFSALQIFNNLSLSINDLVTDCFYAPEVQRDRWSDDNDHIEYMNCSEMGPIVPSIYEGRKCFTFFSQLNNTNEERKDIKMIYEKNPSISVKVSARHNVWPIGPIQFATIIVAAHQPNIIPTHLEFDYFRIFPNRFYEVRVFTLYSTHILIKIFIT
jgi:hypothetical protein